MKSAKPVETPQDDLRLLTRLFSGGQAARGWRAPVVVETLDRAFDRLGVAASDCVG